MSEIVNNSDYLLQKLNTGTEEEFWDLYLYLIKIPHNEIITTLTNNIHTMQNTISSTDFLRRITLVILTQLTSDKDQAINDSTQEILWLCVKNLKHHFNRKLHSVPSKFYKNLKKWTSNITLNPGMCSDPHLWLEIICLKYIFRLYHSDYFPRFLDENHDMKVVFVMTIHQIDVEKYLVSGLNENLLTFRFLGLILKKLEYCKDFDQLAPDPSTLKIFATAAQRLNKNLFSFVNDYCSNLTELLSQTLLIDIKNMCYKDMREIAGSCQDILSFFVIYFQIIAENTYIRMGRQSFLELSIRSAISTITNCIFILKAKLQGLSIKAPDWHLIYQLEKIRDHMARVELRSDSRISIQKFIMERSLGNFDASYTKRLYNMTTYIKQIPISETEGNQNETLAEDLQKMDKDLKDYNHTFIIDNDEGNLLQEDFFNSEDDEDPESDRSVSETDDEHSEYEFIDFE